MNIHLKLAAVALVALSVAACDDTTGSSAGLSGTDAQFNAMTGPCIDQASRVTGAAKNTISVLERLQTGGGPLLTLDAGGSKYSCRLEDDGTVTVFSEFAN